MKSGRISIRASLIGLVLICLFPAILLAAVFVYLDHQSERAKLVRESLSTARALVAVVDSEFAAAETSMYTLSSSVALKNGDMAAFYDRATEVLKRNHVNNIVLIAANGQQLVNTARPWGTPLPKALNTAQLNYVISSGKSNISDLFTGPVLGKPLVNVAVPVFEGKKPVYSLVAVLLPAALQKILQKQRFPGNRNVAIFDGAGSVVALNGDVDRFLGKKVNPGLLAALQQADEGSVETINNLGVEVITAFTRSPTSRWGVAISIPRNTLVAELSKSMWWLLGLGSQLFLCCAGLAYYIGGRITRAIRDLSQPARQLGYGKAVVVPPLPIGEADEVGQAITRASGMLTTARQALTNSDAQMRGIVESATDAVIILDDNWSIVLFNSAAVKMFGCSREAAIGNSFSRFVPERLRADFAVQLKSHRTPQAGTRDLDAIKIATVTRSNGEEFQVELSFPHNVEGHSRLNTLILRDITNRLQTQQALERSNLDLQQFAFVASHDLKTPLRSIGGFLQLLRKNHGDKLDDKARALVQRSLDATARLEQLTEDLLSYARVNSEAKPFAPLSCTEVVNDAISLLDSSINETGAVITLGPLPDIMGDRTQLVQLFLNLLGNGLKYCRGRSPVIHVSSSKNATEWLVSVADNGIGIEARHHERIFEVFKRLHNQNDYPGTGIGLAVCRRVVERHGGSIWVESIPGEGSTFYFTIPELFSESGIHDAEISL
ncbi:MAG: ATP-binding protein [Pseudomonadota bacterium]